MFKQKLKGTQKWTYKELIGCIIAIIWEALWRELFEIISIAEKIARFNIVYFIGGIKTMCASVHVTI
jgi:hypothetical protein